MSSDRADVRGPLRQSRHSNRGTQPLPGNEGREWLGSSKPGQLETELHKIGTQMREGRSAYPVLLPSGSQRVRPVSRNGGCPDSLLSLGDVTGWVQDTGGLELLVARRPSNLPRNFGIPALAVGAMS